MRAEATSTDSSPAREAVARDADGAPLHVGLNLIFLVPGDTGGMEVAARELIPALVDAAPAGTRFTSFVSLDAGPGPWDELTAKIEVPVHAADRVARVRGELQLLPRLARAARVDLVHSLASTAPAWGRFARVVTVHDVIYRRFPETHTGFRSIGMRVLVPLAVRRSHRVIADSESTREDLSDLLGVARERIDVVPLGVGSRVHATPLPESEVRRRFGLGDRRVVLSLSAKRPHKNIEALLDALASIGERPVLVVAGYATAHERTLRARASALGLDEDVRWVGWLDPSELEGLWAISSAFVFPSLYEGFGLPVLEAMLRGVPVACSNASSLPEVAGDAALLFDPRDSSQIAVALQRLLGDTELVTRLRRAGADRAAQFTWQRTARGVLATYQRALSGA